jgi:hypothetical protein
VAEHLSLPRINRLPAAFTAAAKLRLLAVAALGAGLICVLSNVVVAQSTAPIVHRQPTAASVPRDDTAFAPVPHSEARLASRRANRKRSNRHHAEVGFPDICSNCNN